MNSLMRWLRSFEVERLRKIEAARLERRCQYLGICFKHGNPLVTYKQCADCRIEAANEELRLTEDLVKELNEFHGRS